MSGCTVSSSSVTARFTASAVGGLCRELGGATGNTTSAFPPGRRIARAGSPAQAQGNTVTREQTKTSGSEDRCCFRNC